MLIGVTALVSKTPDLRDHLEEALVRQMADAVHAARLCCKWSIFPSAYAGGIVFFFFPQNLKTRLSDGKTLHALDPF